MNDERSTDLLSALPRTRPHRRSDKRGSPPAKPEGQTGPDAGKAPAAQKPQATRKPATRKPATRNPAAARKPAARKPPATRKLATGKPARNPTAAKRLRQPAQPRGIPDARRAPKRKPAPTAAPEIVGTAVQAVGELAEIGLALTARALRNAVSRLPKP
jgi:hypothetical protein